MKRALNDELLRDEFRATGPLIAQKFVGKILRNKLKKLYLRFNLRSVTYIKIL